MRRKFSRSGGPVASARRPSRIERGGNARARAWAATNKGFWEW